MSNTTNTFITLHDLSTATGAVKPCTTRPPQSLPGELPPSPWQHLPQNTPAHRDHSTYRGWHTGDRSNPFSRDFGDWGNFGKSGNRWQY